MNRIVESLFEFKGYEEEERISRLSKSVIEAFLFTITVSGIVIIAGTLITFVLNLSSTHWALYLRWMIGVVIVSPMFIAFFLWLKRRIKDSQAANIALVFCFAFYAATMIVAMLWQAGARASEIPALVLVIVISGFVLGPRAALLFTVLSISSVTFMWWLEQQGKLGFPVMNMEVASKSPYALLTYSCTFIIAGVVSRRVFDNTTEALQESRLLYQTTQNIGRAENLCEILMGLTGFMDLLQVHKIEFWGLNLGDHRLVKSHIWTYQTASSVLPETAFLATDFSNVELGPSNAMIRVGLTSRERPVGNLLLWRDNHNPIPQRHLRQLQAVASQTATALDNQALLQQTRRITALEERQRISHELHDSVTQTLFSASMMAESLATLWETDRAEGQYYLKRLQQLNRGALSEMRTALLEMRPSDLIASGIGNLLNHLARAATGRAGIPVTVDVQGEYKSNNDLKLTLYDITREALNNVVKHAAGVSRATVTLCCNSDEIELQIRDDGCGFDPSDIPHGRLGIRMMQERASAAGAELAVESTVGQGTTVRLTHKGGQWPSQARFES